MTTEAEDTIRDVAVRMLARGEATLQEIAIAANVSRQRVRYWADVDGIPHWMKKRRARVAEIFREHGGVPLRKKRG